MTRYKVEKPAPFVKRPAGYFVSSILPDTKIGESVSTDTPPLPPVAPQGAGWIVENGSYIGSLELETPRRNPKTGKMEDKMTIFHWIAVVRRDSWPTGCVVKIRRTGKNIGVLYPDGSRDKGKDIKTAGYLLGQRYGVENAKSIIEALYTMPPRR